MSCTNWKSARICVLASLALTAGCLEDDPTLGDAGGVQDSGADVGIDGSADAAPDAPSEVGVDAGRDAAGDAGEDSGGDAAPDVAADAEQDTADVGPVEGTIDVLHLEYSDDPDGLEPEVLVVLRSEAPAGSVIDLEVGDETEVLPLGTPTTQRLVFRQRDPAVWLYPGSTRLQVGPESVDSCEPTDCAGTLVCTGENGLRYEVLAENGVNGALVHVFAAPAELAAAGVDADTEIKIGETTYAFASEEFEYRVPARLSAGEGVDTGVSLRNDDLDDDETKQAKSRRVTFVLLRGIVIDEIITSESTEGAYELSAMSSTTDPGEAANMEATADGTDLEFVRARTQRTFSAGVEEFGATAFDVQLTFYDGETEVDTAVVPVAFGEPWANGVTDADFGVGVRVQPDTGCGNTLLVSLDGDRVVTRFEAELIGDDASVTAIGEFVAQTRTVTWTGAALANMESEGGAEIVVFAETESGVEEVTRVATAPGPLADRPDTYDGASSRNSKVGDGHDGTTSVLTTNVCHLRAYDDGDGVGTEVAVRWETAVPEGYTVNLELDGFEPQLFGGDYMFATAAFEIARPDGAAAVTVDGFEDEFVVDADVVETSPEGMEDLTVTLDPRGDSLLITLSGDRETMEAAGAVSLENIVQVNGETAPATFLEVAFFGGFETAPDTELYTLSATVYDGATLLAEGQVVGSLTAEPLIDEVTVLDESDHVEVAVVALVDSFEPTTVSVTVGSDEGDFYVDEQATPAAVERVFIGYFDGLGEGPDTVNVTLMIKNDDESLGEYSVEALAGGGWFDFEAGERVLSVNVRREGPGTPYGEVVVSVIGEDGVQGTVADAQQVTAVSVGIAQEGSVTLSPEMFFEEARRGYSFVSPDAGIAALIESGSAALTVEVAQAGLTTETVTNGIGSLPSITSSKKFVKKYKGKTKFDRKMNESFTD